MSNEVAQSPTQASLAANNETHLESIDISNFPTGYRAIVQSTNTLYVLDKGRFDLRAPPTVLWTQNAYGNPALPGRWIDESIYSPGPPGPAGPPGSAGATGPTGNTGPAGPGILTVPNRAAVSALPDLTLSPFTIAQTIVADASFLLDKNSTLTVDGVNVLSTLSGTGRWLRIQTSIYAYAVQPAWFIDTTSGNEEADGATLTTPIRTLQEWYARTQGCVDPSAAITLLGTPSGVAPNQQVVWPTTDKFHYPPLMRGKATNTANAAITGVRTVSRSSTTSAVSTNPVATAGGESATITDATVANWTADLGKLIVAANGARAWVLKDLGGGVARVTTWSTVGGGSATAPPSGTAYSVVMNLQIDIITDLHPTSDQIQVIDCEVRNSIRTAGNKQQWLGCKFTTAQTVRVTEALFAQCLFQTGAINLSMDVINNTVWWPMLIIANSGFLNSTLTMFRGYAECQSTVFQASGIILGRNPTGANSGASALLSSSGIYGIGILDAPAGGLDIDASSIVYLAGSTLQLWGKANVTFGTRLQHRATVHVVTGVTPTLASTGTELSVPTNPLPPLTPGAVVPATSACTTWAQWAAAPFTKQMQTANQWCTIIGV